MTRSGKPKLTVDAMLQRALEIPGLLSLAAGFTDNSILPREAVRDIVAELLSSDEGNETLQYGNPPGRTELRRELCEYLVEADHAVGGSPGELEPSDVVITNGSQQALFIAVQALCRPGDAVLVETPTYFVYVDLLETLGVKAIPMPARDDSLDSDALPGFFADLKSSGQLAKIRAVYLVSYFSNPTSLSLEAEQKSALLKNLRAIGLHVPILEDIAYREMYFQRPWPAPSLLGGDSEEIPIVLMGTLTKNFSTGLKVGYAVVRSEALRTAMLDIKRGQDFGTGNFVQAIVEKAMRDGIYARFLTRMRAHYSRKHDALHEALIGHGLRDLGWSWQKSAGGLYLWLTSPNKLPTTDDSDFFNACLEEKVLYVPGALCYVSGGTDKVRLSFGYLEGDKLPEAAERFVRAARRV